MIAFIIYYRQLLLKLSDFAAQLLLLRERFVDDLLSLVLEVAHYLALPLNLGLKMQQRLLRHLGFDFCALVFLAGEAQEWLF